MSECHKRTFETFPMDRIKRVDQPTTRIDAGMVNWVRERDAGFCKAAAGDYGPRLQKEFRRFVRKHPVSGALPWMRDVMRPLVDGMTADHIVPFPTDPATMTRHLREAGYFLRAYAVGACELPPYAVDSSKWWFGLEDLNGDGILIVPRNIKSEFEERRQDC